MVRSAPRWLRLVSSAVAAFIIFQIAVQAATWAVAREWDEPCPLYPWTAQPSTVRLQPGLVQHQSWVEFPVPPDFAGYYAFCLDGKVINQGGGRLDFRGGMARFNVPTTWVDLQWLGGRLGSYIAPARWKLGLVCAAEHTCGWMNRA